MTDIKDLQDFLNGDEAAQITILLNPEKGTTEERIYQINKKTGKLEQLTEMPENQNQSSSPQSTDVSRPDWARGIIGSILYYLFTRNDGKYN